MIIYWVTDRKCEGLEENYELNGTVLKTYVGVALLHKCAVLLSDDQHLLVFIEKIITIRKEHWSL